MTEINNFILNLPHLWYATTYLLLLNISCDCKDSNLRSIPKQGIEMTTSLSRGLL